MQSVLIMTCNTHLQALNLLYSYNKIGPLHVALVNRLQEIYPGTFVFRIFFFFFFFTLQQYQYVKTFKAKDHLSKVKRRKVKVI